MIHRLAVATILVTWSAAVVAAPVTEELQAIIDRTLAENPGAPGVAVHVICPAMGLDWSGVAGHPDHGAPEPLTPRHTVRIASNTKTYTAATMLRLVEEGRLNLDDPLSSHLLPAERQLLEGDGYDTGAMTLRQVLSHTSGLADHSDGDTYAARIFAEPEHHWTRDEVLQLCVDLFDPVGAPGERYQYSDTGYILLGAIVERTTGDNLGRSARRLLAYDRLGLDVTYWEIMEAPPAAAGPRAHQYLGPVDCTDFHASIDLYGGGGLVTDVAELARFLRLLLAGAVFTHDATLVTMTGGGTADYRLGLMAVDLAGHLALGHQGFWNTFAFHVPTLDLTVAGAILDHDAVNGRQLATDLTAAVAAALVR
jgi:D-alanyl-D-alanine carboxypeptidase